MKWDHEHGDADWNGLQATFDADGNVITRLRVATEFPAPWRRLMRDGQGIPAATTRI
jgi:hypothetical protein